MPEELTSAQLDAATTNCVVLLDFWHETCPPCGALEPRLEAFARDHRSELAAYRIDVDKDQQTPRRSGVTSIPT